MNSVSYFLPDHKFSSEPILLVVDAKRVMQIIDLANAPFARAKTGTLPMVLRCVIEKNYPIRGTSR